VGGGDQLAGGFLQCPDGRQRPPVAEECFAVRRWVGESEAPTYLMKNGARGEVHCEKAVAVTFYRILAWRSGFGR
jgi:hypothetical protein